MAICPICVMAIPPEAALVVIGSPQLEFDIM
jgi:hypothetical protein